jgi:hypothetical protein
MPILHKQYVTSQIALAKRAGTLFAVEPAGATRTKPSFVEMGSNSTPNDLRWPAPAKRLAAEAFPEG